MVHNKECYRSLPDKTRAVDKEIIFKLLDSEIGKLNNLKKSAYEFGRAKRVTPLGVQSSFQYYEPYPIAIRRGEGAYLYDVDGRKILDLSMGFGAMLAGHLNPIVVEELSRTLEDGTLFVAPSDSSREGAESICKRFSIDWVRFCNSGTESVMYAVRLAKVHTGKKGVVKIEGGYHGSADSVNYSIKPNLGDEPRDIEFKPVYLPGSSEGLSYVVPFNDLEYIENLFSREYKKIACLVIEPVIENLGIVLPEEGYLEGIRELCSRYGIILIFDEVKTGLTAGFRGAASRFNIEPDLICLAKSIGGGVPLAAFGGSEEFFNTISAGKMSHYGTFNGNNLAMAGIRAMDRIASDRTLRSAEKLNYKALDQITEIIKEYELPAHTVGFGVKGAVSWSSKPITNYRDWLESDFTLAKLSFYWSLNNLIMTPPGQDDQWLISLAHGEEEVGKLVEDFRSLAKALRG